MNKSSFLASLLLPLAVAAAPVLSIDDPASDDHGDGSLVYPGGGGLQPGDLDLRRLTVSAEADGLRFEATFRNPIRHPDTVIPDTGGNETLATFARHGFYAFNIDIYIDTDRRPGSGSTATLPGRGARIAAADAWEKVVVLTPRPELMRRQLRDALSESGQAGALATIDSSVFFATDVRVRGRNVSFFVPRSFLGSLNVADWSLTTLVTAAKLTIETDLSFGLARGSALERLTLGVLQPAPGRPLDRMGYASASAPATAVVDLLTPNPSQQAQQLAGGAAITGLKRENRMGAVAPAVPAAAAPATAVPGTAVMPAPAAQAAAPAPVPMQLLLKPPPAAPVAPATAAPAAAAKAVAPAAGAVPPAPLPAAAPAAAAPARSPAPAAAPQRPRDAAFLEELELRLQTLKRLRDRELITEAEYQQKRRELLDQL